MGKNVEKENRDYFDKTQELLGNLNNRLAILLPDILQGLHIITKDKYKELLEISRFKIQPSTYYFKEDYLNRMIHNK